MARKKESGWLKFVESMSAGLAMGLEVAGEVARAENERRYTEMANQERVRAATQKARATALIISYIQEVMVTTSYYRRDAKLRTILDWCRRNGYTEAAQVARGAIAPIWNTGLLFSDSEVISRLNRCVEQSLY